MSVYVPNYKHDIFVSYAHVDNIPVAGAEKDAFGREKGWVTTLISELKKELGRRLGRTDAYSLWMDYELRGNEPLTSDIDQQLNNSATFLLIFSRGYLESQWCLLEMNTFIRCMEERNLLGRTFMVEYDFIPLQEKPPAFQDLVGYPFWIKNNDTGETRSLGIPKPNPDREPEYYQKLSTLAYDLTSKLSLLRSETIAAQSKEASDLSRLVTMKKSRLENERTRLETEITKKLSDHEFTSGSLSRPNLPENTQNMLSDKLHQLETEVEKLEAQKKKIDLELQQLL